MKSIEEEIKDLPREELIKKCIDLNALASKFMVRCDMLEKEIKALRVEISAFKSNV